MVRDSLATIINPLYQGTTPTRDLAFQTFQERDCLERTLEQEGLTVAELLGLMVAGKHKPFFSALGKQAVYDAEHRTCDVLPSVRNLVNGVRRD